LNGDYRLLSVPVRQDSEEIAYVQVGRSLREQSNEAQILGIVVLATGGAGLALATVGGFYIAGRALRPPRLAFERQRQFIADASHEMRTPLTLVRASAEAIQRSGSQNLAEQDREALADIISETDRMAALVNDLMSLALLDAGRPLRARELVDLAGLLTEAAKRARTLSSEGRLSVEHRVTGRLPVIADRDLLSRVLDALVENAVRYTPEGGRIVLTGEATGGNVEVSVADTGPGLTSDEARAVFERFYRTDSARTRERGGSGLGLAIAREIINRHGGRIWASATPGRGATFTFMLPRATHAAIPADTGLDLEARYQD
jgi:signal transduction histidine kinase